jgi:hypothetical protein
VSKKINTVSWIFHRLLGVNDGPCDLRSSHKSKLKEKIIMADPIHALKETYSLLLLLQQQLVTN